MDKPRLAHLTRLASLSTPLASFYNSNILNALARTRAPTTVSDRFSRGVCWRCGAFFDPVNLKARIKRRGRAPSVSEGKRLANTGDAGREGKGKGTRRALRLNRDCLSTVAARSAVATSESSRLVAKNYIEYSCRTCNATAVFCGTPVGFDLPPAVDVATLADHGLLINDQSSEPTYSPSPIPTLNTTDTATTIASPPSAAATAAKKKKTKKKLDLKSAIRASRQKDHDREQSNLNLTDFLNNL